MQLLSQKQLRLAKKLIEGGGVIAVPTETVYGLAAKFDHSLAIAKLLAIKNRKVHDDDKVLTLMLPDKTEIRQYARPSAAATKIAQKHFPGELTLVLPKNPNFKNSYFDHCQILAVQ